MKAQEFYIEALFKDGRSTVLFGHFTNKQLQPGIRCINHLKAELNSICHLLALLGAHHILHVSRIRAKVCSLTSRMDTFVKKRLPDCTSSHTRVVRFTNRNIQSKNKGFYR